MRHSYDIEHLRLLSIFHYVMAGLMFLFGSFFLIYVFMGIAILNGGMNGGPNPPPPGFGWFFIIFGGVFVAWGWISAVLTAIAGRCLGRYRARMFCIVVAALSCLNVPLGTILGVFTLIVLMRPNVTRIFAEGGPHEHRDDRDFDHDFEPEEGLAPRRRAPRAGDFDQGIYRDPERS